MTLDLFRLLAPRAQLLVALLKGTYLARRWVQPDSGVNLYYLRDGGRGFFVEVGISEAQDCFEVVRSFHGSELLVAYTHEIQLPEV